MEDIRKQGMYASLKESSQPYIEAVWQNFSTERTTVTEDLLTGRLVGRTWRGVRRWFGATEEADENSENPPTPDTED